MYKISDFEDLKIKGFERTYNKIEEALYYYSSLKDYKTCCARFRFAMESSVKDIYKILEKTIFPLWDSYKRIELLKGWIPSRFKPDHLCEELHSIRKISNLYSHDTERQRDLYRDFKTCYIAMKEIQDWLLPFSNEYPIYKKEEEERQRERRRSKKQRNKRIAGIAATVTAVIGSIWGYKKWKKKK